LCSSISSTGKLDFLPLQPSLRIAAEVAATINLLNHFTEATLGSPTNPGGELGLEGLRVVWP